MPPASREPPRIRHESGATAPADEHRFAIRGLPLSEDRLSLREAARRMIGS
jgi:hypothetical protein